ncbi:MAG: hypothetical protein K8S54_00550, partial [Spirochaetia bacterium]|nr:hypothetical protein [Spirochaetia bacterium]
LGRKSVRWINNLGNLQIVTIAPEKDVLSGLTHWTSQHLADFWEIRHIMPILIAILGILLAMRFRKRPERLALLFPCAGILSILIAANIFGPQVGIGTMQDRYVFFALFATVILICYQFAKSRLVRYVFLGFSLMLTIASIRSTSEGKDHPLFTSRDCLIGLMGKADLKYGIADYWYAKPYTVLSDRKIQLNEVDLSLGPRPWINNIDRFFTPTGIPDYNYLIANNLPEELIIQRLGAPTRRSNCGHLSIWIYDANQNPGLANLFTPHQMQIWRGALGR